MTDEILYENISQVYTDNYTFLVHSVETHWKGHDSGKMEDMPGNFLSQTISLRDCSKPSHLESIAIEKKLVLRESKKEITNEPEGYSKLKHKQLIKHVKEHPGYYLQTLQRVVKDSL